MCLDHTNIMCRGWFTPTCDKCLAWHVTWFSSACQLIILQYTCSAAYVSRQLYTPLRLSAHLLCTTYCGKLQEQRCCNVYAWFTETYRPGSQQHHTSMSLLEMKWGLLIHRTPEIRKKPANGVGFSHVVNLYKQTAKTTTSVLPTGFPLVNSFICLFKLYIGPSSFVVCKGENPLPEFWIGKATWLGRMQLTSPLPFPTINHYSR